MQSPTTAQIRTAIEVLKKFSEHINTNAANEVIGLHESPHSDRQAARIGSRTIDQTTRIEAVAGNWKTGATNCCNRGGSVFLNAFNPVQALLLSSLRILRPQSGRAQRAEQPCKVVDSWPQTRHVHEHKQAEVRPQLRLIRVREQSTSASSPSKRARAQPVHIRGNDAASTGRVSAAATGMDVPHTDRESEHVTATDAPLTGIEREPDRARNYPSRRIAVNVMPSFNFPVHIRHNPAYVRL